MNGITLKLTDAETVALLDALLDLNQDMNDDGREGHFESTPLQTIYEKVWEARRAARKEKGR